MNSSNLGVVFYLLASREGGAFSLSPSTQPSSEKVPPVPAGRYLRHASAEDGQLFRNLSSWKQIEHD